MSIFIEDITPDFFAFWDRAQGCGIEDQKRLWREMYEEKHSDIFGVYYGGFGDRRALEEALIRYTDEVPRIRSLLPNVGSLLADVVPRCAELFDTRGDELPCVLMVGLFTSDAWAARLRGRGTFFLALEAVSKPPRLDITVAHEAAHTFHGRCSPAGAPAQATVADTLFSEGLAVFSSRVACPGFAEPDYLLPDAALPYIDSPAAWIAECEAAWGYLRRRLLDDADRPNESHGGPYFRELPEDIPLRAGYFAGYRVVRFLGRRHTLA